MLQWFTMATLNAFRKSGAFVDKLRSEKSSKFRFHLYFRAAVNARRGNPMI